MFKLGIENDLNPRNDVVLGLKVQGHRVNKCILHTNEYACVNAHLTDNSNTAWV